MTPIKKSNDFNRINQMTSIKGWKQLLNFSTPLLTGEKVNGDKKKQKLLQLVKGDQGNYYVYV